METTREREERTTTGVLPVTESEGPKETNGTTMGQIITEPAMKKTLPDSTTIASILSPVDLTNEQVCKIIIELAKMVIEENGGKDIKFKKEEKYDII